VSHGRLLGLGGSVMVGVGLHLVLMPSEPFADTLEWLAGAGTALALILAGCAARGLTPLMRP
jgi:hypothetical protein